jgi:hypothetical protein
MSIKEFTLQEISDIGQEVEQESVAWKCECGANLFIDEAGNPCSKAPPKRENELDAIDRAYFAGKQAGIAESEAVKREWVGLTDEEFNKCLVEGDPCEALAEPEAWEIMRSVEAKLKEKNT